jgi:NAD(P)-dependent dehydrogenase (short-subunit alcohol dehydrogenase family)
MPLLRDKNMVVIGGSRGVGRWTVEAGVRNGARVLAVALKEGPLRLLDLYPPARGHGSLGDGDTG